MLEQAPLPSLSSIRAFEAAARLGSFARAAVELGTSAAAVSYHVRQVERQLGTALFVRHARSVTLTEAGTVIASEASRCFASLRATFVAAADAHASRLSLTALPTFGSSWLAPRLGRFGARCPDLSVALDLSARPEPLGQGHFDAAIRNGSGDWAGLRSIRLFPSLFMPLCSPGLLDAAKGIGDANAPLRVPLLGREDWWAIWHAAVGVSRPDLDMKPRTVLSAEYLDAAAAIAGMGVTIGSPILFADELRAGRLVPADPRIASDGRAFWLVYPLAHGGRGKITRFREWLCEEAELAISDLPVDPAGMRLLTRSG
jgi:LysR family transcriptional regulator, glycine cleavage system transcriptional activator